VNVTNKLSFASFIVVVQT
jgi:hypothetical protein